MKKERDQLIILVTIFFTFSGLSHAENYFDRYNLVPFSPSVDLGVQPLGYPTGIIGTLLSHDRILKKALADKKQSFKTHPFQRGADMVALLADHRLEGGLMGDMPTILSACLGKVWIVGLVKEAPTGIVAKGTTTVRGLKGRRIGYVEGSTAHYTLLEGLASGGVSENQVKLISMRVDDMPSALEKGVIDAFAGWEPATSIALRNSGQNLILFRGISRDFFVIEKDFVKRFPEVSRQLIAGLWRAVEWLRLSPKNLGKAIQWTINDARVFSGRSESLPVSEIMAITRRSLLNVPSAPTILQSSTTLQLMDEFQFLTRLKKLPAKAKWENVEAAFKYDGLSAVLAEPSKFKINSFDYQD